MATYARSCTIHRLRNGTIIDKLVYLIPKEASVIRCEVVGEMKKSGKSRRDREGVFIGFGYCRQKKSFEIRIETLSEYPDNCDHTWGNYKDVYILPTYRDE